MKSPYIDNDNRLADVIAAIQVMGIYKFYKLDFANWADRIVGDTSKANEWEIIFREHPEFFRLDQTRKKASLVWRRQYPKRFNVDQEKELSKEEIERLNEEQKMRISRIPLEPETIGTLIRTAIDLHARALVHKQDNRWLKNTLIGGVGGLIVALANFLFRTLSIN